MLATAGVLRGVVRRALVVPRRRGLEIVAAVPPRLAATPLCTAATVPPATAQPHQASAPYNPHNKSRLQAVNQRLTQLLEANK